MREFLARNVVRKAAAVIVVSAMGTAGIVATPDQIEAVFALVSAFFS